MFTLVVKEVNKSEDFIMSFSSPNYPGINYYFRNKNIISLDEYKKIPSNSELAKKGIFVFDLVNLYPDGNNETMVKDTLDDSKIESPSLIYYCNDPDIDFKLKVFKDERFDNKNNGISDLIFYDYYREEVNFIIFDTVNNLNLEEIYLSYKINALETPTLTELKNCVRNKNLIL